MSAPDSTYFTYNTSLPSDDYIIHIGVIKAHVVDGFETVVLRVRRSLATINQRDVFYADESENQEVASVICLGVGQGLTFHIQDKNRLTHGILKPNWLIGSFLQEEWSLDSEEGQVVYQIKEDNLVFSLIRRYFKTFPQTYTVTAKGQDICRLSRGWNPFLPTMTVTFLGTTEDKCLLLLAAFTVATCDLQSSSI